jgi:hypothetical protein
MGYEIVKGKDGLFYVWNTRIDTFEFKFKNTVQLIDFIEQKCNCRLTEEQKNDWIKACDEAPDMDTFLKGMTIIPMDMIRKFAEKTLT